MSDYHIWNPAMFAERECQDLAIWISSIDYAQVLADNLDAYATGTSRWIFDTQDFKNWMKEDSGLLWCVGNRKYISVNKIYT